MNIALFNTAFSAGAILIPANKVDETPCTATPEATAFAAVMADNGYGLDQKLFRALCHLEAADIAAINEAVEEKLQLKLNWMPLIKGWTTPTGATFFDALVAMFANMLPPLRDVEGVTLPCGHFIPKGTFPLERYNGCPLCGTPFDTSAETFHGQGSNLKPLTLWTETDLRAYELSLLQSRVPLDATQTVALRTLIAEYGVPAEVDIPMRETAIIAFLALAESGDYDRAATFIKTPVDLLRALWSEKTGLTRIVTPAKFIARQGRTVGYAWQADYRERVQEKENATAAELKLKYPRAMCRFAATLFENMPGSPEGICELMHPQRGMWVRFIRALRLSEYARRHDHPRLREILDRFYRTDYPVWAGEVETAMLGGETERALALLKQRPGTFARMLVAAMLHLGQEPVLAAFAEVAERLPMRLLVTLDMYIAYCLDPQTERSVRIAGGGTHVLTPSAALQAKTPAETAAMTDAVKKICADAIRRQFAGDRATAGTVYIAPELFNIPVPIGERAVSAADDGYVTQGTSFDISGDNVRLFLHWGEGLPAQHIDMDLSAIIVYDDHRTECAYYNHNPTGAIHSGDIQQIPDMVGAAEYIELDIPALAHDGARYVIFNVSAYTSGGIHPTVRVGWMDSKYPMKVSSETGVAYDPSTVQFSARVAGLDSHDQLVFGILDISRRSIAWLEMADNGQIARNIDINKVKALMDKLSQRMSIGQLLLLRAEALGQRRIDSPAEGAEVFRATPADIAHVAGFLG